VRGREHWQVALATDVAAAYSRVAPISSTRRPLVTPLARQLELLMRSEVTAHTECGSRVDGDSRRAAAPEREHLLLSVAYLATPLEITPLSSSAASNPTPARAMASAHRARARCKKCTSEGRRADQL
jgi:hypothetical protein